MNLETSIPVPQIQIWTLITGHFKQTHNHSAVLMYSCELIPLTWWNSLFLLYVFMTCGSFLSSSRLLWEVWIPVMRSCVSGWQPRMVGPMVDCVEMWAPLLPLWILDHLLEQLILPRLQREARNIRSLHLTTHLRGCQETPMVLIISRIFLADKWLLHCKLFFFSFFFCLIGG